MAVACTVAQASLSKIPRTEAQSVMEIKNPLLGTGSPDSSSWTSSACSHLGSSSYQSHSSPIATPQLVGCPRKVHKYLTQSHAQLFDLFGPQSNQPHATQPRCSRRTIRDDREGTFTPHSAVTAKESFPTAWDTANAEDHIIHIISLVVLLPALGHGKLHFIPARHSRAVIPQLPCCGPNN